MDLNLRLLRYFVMVVDEGHFGRAATKLYISPPALTQQIRRLERDVGFSILDRAARPVAPTPAGAAFLEEARAVLAAADRLTTVAQVHARKIGNRFALGFFTTPLGRHTRRLVDSFTAGRGSLWSGTRRPESRASHDSEQDARSAHRRKRQSDTDTRVTLAG